MSDSAHITAIDTLASHGKSFRFAGAFLSNSQLQQAARLYHFCRCIDDIADETACKTTAFSELKQIQQQLIANDPADNALLVDFIQLKDHLQLSVTWPNTLIDGVIADTAPFTIRHENDLIRYAYQVAGVVGLMMCPIIKADHDGYAFAVDLGIAMQLTNIARDVYEDAHLGRSYLPQDWCDCTPAEIINNQLATQKKVKLAIKRLLALADQYYASAQIGFHFLPFRSRLAIAIASNVYRHIGKQICRSDYRYWQGRVFVPFAKKIVIAVSAGLSLLFLPTKQHHNQRLHRGIDDLLDLEPSSL